MTLKETKILTGVLGAAILVAGFVYAHKLREKQASPQAQNQSPSAEETANWKTYRNEDYGFEVKYPEDWNFKEQTSPSDGFFISKGDSRLAVLPQGEFDYGLPLSEPATSEDTLAGKKATIRKWGSINLLIYNFRDRLPELWIECSDDLKACNRLDIFALNQEDLSTLTAVLLTLTFIEPVYQTNISNWKSCQNQENGYEVKYNPSWEVVDDFDCKYFERPSGYTFVVMVNKDTLGNIEKRANEEGSYLYNFVGDGINGRRLKNVIYIQNGSRVYSIYMEGYGLLSPTKTDRKEFEVFARSIKFIEFNWETYQNDKYGYKLSYPEYLTPYEEIDDEHDELLPASSASSEVGFTTKETCLFYPRSCIWPTLYFSIVITDDTPQKWFDQNLKPYATSTSQTEFAGKGALQAIFYNYPWGISKSIIVPGDGYLLEIRQNGQNDLLDQILPTFKFTK